VVSDFSHGNSFRYPQHLYDLYTKRQISGHGTLSTTNYAQQVSLTMQDGFEEILLEASAEMQELAKRTRVLIKKIMPDVVEAPWLKQKNAGYVVGLKKMLEHFCYISVFNNENSFPEFVKKLPKADYSSDGAGTIRGFAVESKNHKVVYQ